MTITSIIKTVTFTRLLLNQWYQRYQVLFSVPDDSFPIQMTAGVPRNFLKRDVLVSYFFARGVTLKSLLRRKKKLFVSTNPTDPSFSCQPPKKFQLYFRKNPN